MTMKTNPHKDVTQRAFDVFQQAIGEEELEGKSLIVRNASLSCQILHFQFLPTIG